MGNSDCTYTVYNNYLHHCAMCEYFYRCVRLSRVICGPPQPIITFFSFLFVFLFLFSVGFRLLDAALCGVYVRWFPTKVFSDPPSLKTPHTRHRRSHYILHPIIIIIMYIGIYTSSCTQYFVSYMYIYNTQFTSFIWKYRCIYVLKCTYVI